MRDDSAWIARGVFGERLWSNRHQVAVPARHLTMPHVLNLASLTGFPLLVWGLVALDPWPTMFGMALIIGGKLWYIDRMAILYEDMTALEPALRYRRPAGGPVAN